MLQIKKVRCLVWLLRPPYCCLPGSRSLHHLRARGELHCALWGVLIPPSPLALPGPLYSIVSLQRLDIC